VRSHANLYCYYRRHETFIVRYWVHQLDFLRYRYCPLSNSEDSACSAIFTSVFFFFLFGFESLQRIATLISHGTIVRRATDGYNVPDGK
jgi:hypothetical protein